MKKQIMALAIIGLISLSGLEAKVGQRIKGYWDTAQQKYVRPGRQWAREHPYLAGAGASAALAAIGGTGLALSRKFRVDDPNILKSTNPERILTALTQVINDPEQYTFTPRTPGERVFTLQEMADIFALFNKTGSALEASYAPHTGLQVHAIVEEVERLLKVYMRRTGGEAQ